MGSIGGDEVASIAGGGKDRILVSVRVRPLNRKELERNDVSDWECINNDTIIFKNNLPVERSMFPTAYTFDRVFSRDAITKQVYEEGAKEVALSVVSGINSSIFAYGQTSSGKTYTMTGITDYSVADIYDYIEKHTEREFLLKFSAMEIYNEAVRDLLSPDSAPLRLLDDPEKGTIVEKLTEETLRDRDHLKELLCFCGAQRQIGETALNEMSSRSHQILRLTIESSAKEFWGMTNSSTLAAAVNFVDLAGSERASQALSAGARLKEGCHINRSLLTLGTVIRKLSKGRNGHVPYRDSKLTRILQSSLGGNAKTAIICTMSPARSHIEQSRNTLQFASCAKEVATNAQVNVVMSDKALVKHLQRELSRLENEIRYSRPTTANNPDALREKDAQIKKMEKEMKELIQQRDLSQSRLEDLLRALGDDQTARQWEELSQSSVPHAPNSCDETLSISDTSGIGYQSPDFGSMKFAASPGVEQNALSSLYHSSNIPIFTGRGNISRFSSHDFDEPCKEVRCIEMVEPRINIIDDGNLLLTEVSDNLLSPSINAQNHNDLEPKPKEGKGLTLAPSPLPLPNVSSSSRGLTLVRSRSCRATLMTTSSPSFPEVDENINTPPDNFLKDFPGRPKRLSEIPYGSGLELHSQDGEMGRHSRVGSRTSGLSVSDDDLKPENVKTSSELCVFNDVSKLQKIKTSPNEGITDTSNFVEGVKEIDQIQYQKQVVDGQDSENSSNCDSGVKITIKDVCLDPALKSFKSPSKWQLEFEKKQRDMIELWDACNVSLIHRSYLFLTFKGDPTDSTYMEVEHRRLSFIKNSFSEGSLNKTTMESCQNDSILLSQKIIRREREKLSREMKKLSTAERERLYTKWGIALDSKQRRMQLARLVWTDTNDTEHVRESATLVVKLFGFSLPVQAPPKAPEEMFGLIFAPQLNSRKSFSWINGKSSFM